MLVIAELKSDSGQSIGTISVPPKQFKTGSRGYFGMAKIEVDGKRYQVQIQMVEIGSKPPTENEEK